MKGRGDFSLHPFKGGQEVLFHDISKRNGDEDTRLDVPQAIYVKMGITCHSTTHPLRSLEITLIRYEGVGAISVLPADGKEKISNGLPVNFRE